MTLRLLDAGTLSPLRSQSIYHGLAYARTEDTPDTVVIATPAEPYVCIGFHQDLEREVDVEYCNSHGLPIVRREVGGGLVYLDSDQLFVQWIMAPTSLPSKVDERFELFARPIVETYRALGVPATFRPVNDIHAGDRKIGGTGAGRIANAEVLVGNFLFDFDTEAMARILRVPSESFRDEVRRSLARYMTTFRQELAEAPSQDEVRDLYIYRCREALGRELHDGGLTPAELAAMESVERRLASADFLHRPGGYARDGVKIHEDVWVREVDRVPRTITQIAKTATETNADVR